MRRPSLLVGFATLVTAVLTGILAWYFTPISAGPIKIAYIAGPTKDAIEIGGAFEMTAHTGETVTDKTFEGKFLLVFFGYTFCPDICPTILKNVALALRELGGDAAAVQPLFVSVDPARDTPAVLAEYLRAFDPSILGLTGTPEQTAGIAEAYRAFFEKIEDDDNDPNTYLMGHTAYIYLMGRDGKLLTVFSYPANPKDMAAEIAKYLEQGEPTGRIETPNAVEPAKDPSVPGDHVQGS